MDCYYVAKEHLISLDNCAFSCLPRSAKAFPLEHLTHWGVEMARKVGVPPQRVFNAPSSTADALSQERKAGGRPAELRRE
jgi:hypothetical protein